MHVKRAYVFIFTHQLGQRLLPEKGYLLKSAKGSKSSYLGGIGPEKQV